MTNNKYNFWAAIAYEILRDLSDEFEFIRKNKIIKLILKNLYHDWTLWKIETTFKEVDKQVQEIKKQWEAEDTPKYTFIESEPDGSQAQSLLGGAMEIKSNFKRE